MKKNDFSIRIEVEAMLENMNMKMTQEQINEVIDDIQCYGTFLDVVALFVAKSIRNVFIEKGLKFDNKEIEHQIQCSIRGMNLNDLNTY